MQTEIDGSVFAGFKRVLRMGTLIFALIIAVLFALIFYQHQRSAEAVRSVEHTRQVITYIDALRTYLLNLDTAVRKYAETQNRNFLDPSLICRQSTCPSAEHLIALVGADEARAARLAPLPALQSALETGFSALQERAAARGAPGWASPPSPATPSPSTSPASSRCSTSRASPSCATGTPSIRLGVSCRWWRGRFSTTCSAGGTRRRLQRAKGSSQVVWDGLPTPALVSHARFSSDRLLSGALRNDEGKPRAARVTVAPAQPCGQPAHGLPSVSVSFRYKDGSGS